MNFTKIGKFDVSFTKHRYGISNGQSLPVFLSLAAILLSVCAGSYSVQVYSSGAASPTLDIRLSPDSSPRFFVCNVTPTNGSSTLAGNDESDSARIALTDGDLDTAILGNATFDVYSNGSTSSFVNGPGPDLRIVELHGAEFFNVTVHDPESGENVTISGSAAPTDDRNGCNYIINETFIDLSSFGIAEGSSVPSVRFDNLGGADSLVGADIAEVMQIDETSSSMNSTQDSSSINLGGILMPAPNG